LRVNTTGANNTAIGFLTLDANTTATGNTAVGQAAMGATTTGANNTAVGIGSLGANVTGASNTAIGKEALNANTSGGNNTAGGFEALTKNTTGESNTAFGRDALYNNTTADNNVAVGQSALNANTTGAFNTAMGFGSGIANTTGSGNVTLGFQCGDNTTTGDSNISIGQDAQPSAVDTSHSIQIGVGFGVGGNSFGFGKASNVVSNTFTSNASFSRSSDVNKKTNIEDDSLGLSFINNLRTVKFNWRPNSEFPKHYKDYSETKNDMDTDVRLHGMIAQEVKAALDIEGVDTFGGWLEEEDGSQRISQEMFVHPLIKAVQELSTQVGELQSELKTLKGE